MEKPNTRYTVYTRYSWDGALICYMFNKWMEGSDAYMMSAGEIERNAKSHAHSTHPNTFAGIVYCDVPPLYKHRNQLMFTHMASLYREYEDIETIDKQYSGVNATSQLVFEWIQTFNPDAKPPRCLEYIDDLTMWKWINSRSRDFYENVKNKIPNIAEITKIELMAAVEFKTFLDRASVMRDTVKETMGQLSCNNMRVDIAIGGHAYPALLVESASFVNEIAERLFETEAIYVVAVYSYDVYSARWNVSVRTPGGGPIDAGHLASLYGGGGSRGAAGFKYTGDLRVLFTDNDSKIAKYSLKTRKPTGLLKHPVADLADNDF